MFFFSAKKSFDQVLSTFLFVRGERENVKMINLKDG